MPDAGYDIAAARILVVATGVMRPRREFLTCWPLCDCRVVILFVSPVGGDHAGRDVVRGRGGKT